MSSRLRSLPRDSVPHSLTGNLHEIPFSGKHVGHPSRGGILVFDTEQNKFLVSDGSKGWNPIPTGTEKINANKIHIQKSECERAPDHPQEGVLWVDSNSKLMFCCGDESRVISQRHNSGTFKIRWSVDGDDNNDGITHPVRTWSKLKSILQNVNYSTVIVYIHGDVEIEETPLDEQITLYGDIPYEFETYIDLGFVSGMCTNLIFEGVLSGGADTNVVSITADLNSRMKYRKLELADVAEGDEGDDDKVTTPFIVPEGVITAKLTPSKETSTTNLNCVWMGVLPSSVGTSQIKALPSNEIQSPGMLRMFTANAHPRLLTKSANRLWRGRVPTLTFKNLQMTYCVECYELPKVYIRHCVDTVSLGGLAFVGCSNVYITDSHLEYCDLTNCDSIVYSGCYIGEIKDVHASHVEYTRSYIKNIRSASHDSKISFLNSEVESIKSYDSKITAEHSVIHNGDFSTSSVNVTSCDVGEYTLNHSLFLHTDCVFP